MKIHVSYTANEMQRLFPLIDHIKQMEGITKVKADNKTGRIHLYFVQKNTDTASNKKAL